MIKAIMVMIVWLKLCSIGSYTERSSGLGDSDNDNNNSGDFGNLNYNISLFFSFVQPLHADVVG